MGNKESFAAQERIREVLVGENGYDALMAMLWLICEIANVGGLDADRLLDAISAPVRNYPLWGQSSVPSNGVVILPTTKKPSTVH